jgi:hypothetical protein
MSIDPDRGNDCRALADPVIEEAIARLRNAGIQPHEIAQLMILNGAGLLSASLGPKHAGYAVAEVADSVAGWLHGIADAYSDRAEH